MRKIILGLAAAIGILATLGLTAPADAYTPNADGSVFVSKGEVQSAFKWNNHNFDAKVDSLKFDGDVAATQSNHFEGTCGGTTYTGDLVTTITRAALNPTPVKSDNDKQITGWNLNVGAIKSSSTDYAHSTLNRAQNAYTMCKLLGGTDSGSAFSLVKGDAAIGSVSVTSSDGTRVLPLTPVV